MRVAVVTDSNSGMTQTEGEELGIFVLPMPFTINGKEYHEGVNLTQEEFFRQMTQDADITTSQPSPEDLTGLWDKLLKEYDELVYIPMSGGLSSSCQTASMLARDYGGRVQVADNHRISVTQRRSALDALELAENGWSAEQIREELERTGGDSVIYIMVDTLKYLKKGGRITPAAAALGTLLKLKPVLTILGEKLDAFSKARTMKQAKAMMLSAVAKDLENRLRDRGGRETWLEIAHTQNEEAALLFREEVKEAFPGIEVYVAPLSLGIACHIGPGSLALTATRKLDAGKVCR